MNERLERRFIAAAERQVRGYAESPHIELSYTDHARDRMYERGIDGADILHVLRCGHVSGGPEPADRPNYYKYKICAKTPNTGSRTICAVIIPSIGRVAAKVITVMWEDLK